MWPPFGRRNLKKFSEYQKRTLSDIHEKQKRDISDHVVDEVMLRKLLDEEKYILEEQKAILNLHKNVGIRQDAIDKKIKKLRLKNKVGKYAGDMIENLTTWDGKYDVDETACAQVKQLQQEAIEIVEDNWKTKLAIDEAVDEVFQLEKRLMTIETNKSWKEHLERNSTGTADATPVDN